MAGASPTVHWRTQTTTTRGETFRLGRRVQGEFLYVKVDENMSASELIENAYFKNGTMFA